MESLYLLENPESFGGYSSPVDKSKFLLIGFPYDSTSSYRPGQRFGPSEIRKASRYIEYNSLRAGLDIDYYGGITDLGDVAVVYGDPKETVRRIEDVYRNLSTHVDKTVIMIGGEHLGTLGVLSAYRNLEPCLIWIDAHMDLRKEYLGCMYSHASVVRRLWERYGERLSVFYLGTRGFSADEYSFAESRGFEIVTSLEAREIGLEMTVLKAKKFLSSCDKFYISIDMDAFDPSYAPGVGNPEPEGMSPTFVLDFLWQIVDDRIMGFDVMETDPPYDPTGITSVLAAKIVVELSAMVLKKKYL
jgi:agmatinase